MRSIAVVAVVLVAGCGNPLVPAENGGSQAPLIASSYRAPWRCGERYYVSQGNRGDLCTSHDGDHVAPLQAFAWDFALPRGTPVAASRAGTVTLADAEVGPGDECYDGCPDAFGSDAFEDCCARCLLRSNHVNVTHDDGTVATYWHLDQIAVAVGQVVQAGAVIGYSGTSGCSTGPHLHFQVMEGCSTDFCASIPIQFAEADVPACGDRVTSENACP